MKKFSSIILSMLVVSALVLNFGCSKDEAAAPAPTPAVKTLSITPPTQAVAKELGTFNITVSSNTSWTATSSVPWCVVAPASGENNGTIVVTYTANEATAQRIGTITISGTGVAAASASVTQAGQEAATTGTINVQCVAKDAAGPWTVSKWIAEADLVTESGTVIGTKTVSVTGTCTFTNVAPGTYEIDADGTFETATLGTWNWIGGPAGFQIAAGETKNVLVEGEPM